MAVVVHITFIYESRVKVFPLYIGHQASLFAFDRREEQRISDPRISGNALSQGGAIALDPDPDQDGRRHKIQCDCDKLCFQANAKID